MVLLGLLLLFSSDSLVGVDYEWLGVKETTSGFCAEVRIVKTDRPLIFAWQESADGKSWSEVKQVRIDRWAPARSYELCQEREKPGVKVRLVLRGISSAGPRAVLYEGMPWGAAPLSADISIEKESQLVLRVAIAAPGVYLLRAFNRFGEEIFTIPVESTGPQELKYALPADLRGSLLVQLYSLSYQKLLVEKPIRL